MKSANSGIAGLGTTVFEVMSALAREHKSVNLGQGFPDDKGPEEVRRAAADFLLNGHNQYPPMMGIPELRQALADYHSILYGIAFDVENFYVCQSGMQSVQLTIQALLEPGDDELYEARCDAHWTEPAPG